ncbi:hypothetical protein Sulku_2551 (plasmid) [Sulfuricurvum kujiense DSM 16994]|uniref:Uncharacterized protein n=1 Tax=Sulfuricurvum kujiense (strain ATCC BAA-921 / DSM 16994 / JCM 11577 / YK-1) TaxID=709032 RepID=E4U3E4_SULKY|nr:hypothetical protein [Sulfuricurvum kujiense]ADR35210.1 hypothetical protein Sulku_2551 [Sulfuricurvum kujiense DSM 16994]
MKIEISKRMKVIFAVVGLVAVLTNPGKLELSDFSDTLNFPSMDTYHNILFFSFGNEYASSDVWTPKYKLVSTHVYYIGMFYNYFSIVKSDDGVMTFKVIAK